MKGSLLRAELHRFRSRRFIVVLLLLALGVFLAITAISSTQFAKPSAAGLADARERVKAAVAEQQRAQQDCLSHVPAGQDPVSFCGPAGETPDFRVEDFVDKRPFVLATAGPSGATGVAGATSALLFVIGATWIGAEWSTRSIVALLFWEPRRTKVVTTKLAVLLGAAALIAATTQALWFGAAHLLAATRGTSGGLPPGFYGDLLANEARGVVLGVLLAAVGFALANLVRNTGAALGIAFVYIVVLENAIRALRPRWVQGLLTENAAALVTRGGRRVYLEGTTIDARGGVQAGREIVLSNLHGGLVLGAFAAALVAVGAVLFSRRDLQ